MPNKTKTKIIPLVILGFAILTVAFFIVKENFALSKEGKIVTKTTTIDSDGDGLTDAEEAKYKTNPSQTDSDGDGVSDLDEIQKKTDPNKADQIPGNVDSDNDGLTNDEETKYNTDPNKADTDGDGYLDGEEIISGFDPLIPSETPKVTGASDEMLKSLAEGLDPEKLLENVDTSPVELPEIPDSELNITEESSKEAARKYFDEVDKIFKKNLPFVVGTANIQSYASKFFSILPKEEEIQDLINKIKTTQEEIKKISTPKECTELKKMTLQLLSVSPDVIKQMHTSYQTADIASYTSTVYKIQSLVAYGESVTNEIASLREKYKF